MLRPSISFSAPLLMMVTIVVFLQTSHAGPLNDCPIDCGPSGYCFDRECQCYPGFAGYDCSLPYEICPDKIMQCFGTGAKCVKDRNTDQDSGSRQHAANGDASQVSQYKCYCDKDASNMDPFQIEQCEAPTTQNCQVGHNSPSEFSFCTNGGTCRDMVSEGERHAGCNCPEDFEGRHCQYRKGTAPAYELQQNGDNTSTSMPTERVVVDTQTNPSTGDMGDNTSPSAPSEVVVVNTQTNQSTGALDRFVKFLIAVVCLSLIAGFGYIVYQNYLSKQEAVVPNELADRDLKTCETDLTLDVSGDEIDISDDNNDNLSCRDVDKGEMA